MRYENEISGKNYGFGGFSEVGNRDPTRFLEGGYGLTDKGTGKRSGDLD